MREENDDFCAFLLKRFHLRLHGCYKIRFNDDVSWARSNRKSGRDYTDDADVFSLQMKKLALRELPGSYKRLQCRFIMEIQIRSNKWKRTKTGNELCKDIRTEIKIMVSKNGNIIADAFHCDCFIKGNSFLQTCIQLSSWKNVIAG